MKRGTALAGSALFLVIAPGTVMILVPWWISRWHIEPPLLGLSLFRVIGVIMMVAGLPVLLDSFARFALQGLGTPAPVAPPAHLVVTGLYRYVRNPMYVSGVLIIAGQGLFFGNLGVLTYVLVVWLIFHLFVLFYEEPVLRGKFGAEYDEFRANVRRWVPRLRPWQGK
ncbi:MAG TPA: isoprenylcysteine carboxylmethyltransferase family protein [Candidatus Angelobacter sp.]|jgi:protein-S-isoprenylcysteine O-methyltransferase Ste14|nr:isoprenylcysteine carboxylmethyltransferase family protein [Candidatus Angelobacter sp.]